MFGLFATKLQREDKNELDCLMERAQDYANGNYGVTREYVMQCVNDYMTRGAYNRNRTSATDTALSKVHADIERGDRLRSGRSGKVIKTFIDYD